MGNEAFGVVYVNAPVRASSLDPAHVSLFETITGLASEIAAAAQTRERLLAAHGQMDALRTVMWEEHRLVRGTSAFSEKLENLLDLAASQDVTVLLTGDTGTGKEMAARAIHRRSSRREGPFVPVNSAALPRDIIEAELFGVEKGAYTGAAERRPGRFELATDGTVAGARMKAASPSVDFSYDFHDLDLRRVK